jgi:hypothetical protein
MYGVGPFSTLSLTAVATDSLPKCGPEEMNVASLVDRLVRPESAVADIESKINSFDTTIASNHAQVIEIVDMDNILHKRLIAMNFICVSMTSPLACHI